MRLYCIGRRDRPERRKHIEAQNLELPVLWVDAVPFEELEMFGGVHSDTAVIEACTRSHRLALQRHADNFPDEGALILEDDATLVDGERYKEFIKTPPALPSALGALHERPHPPYFVFAHAMFVPSNYIKNIHKFERGKGNAELAYHNAFGRINVINPAIFTQAGFVSDRTGRKQNY